ERPISLYSGDSMTEQLPDMTQRLLLGSALFTAIPVVTFALWADYLGRYIELRMNPPEDLEIPEEDLPPFDPQVEFQRVRWGGMMALVVQLVIFLLNRETRAEYPFYSIGLLLVALFLQSQIQYGLERR